MTAVEAQLAAKRAFGGVEQTKERHRDVRSLRWLDDAGRDVRYALRTLAKTPGFTAVAVLTLAVGIGANAAIFSVIRAVLLKPLPFPDADRLVVLGEVCGCRSGYEGAVSAPNYLDWTQQNTVFERMAAVTGGGVTLSGAASGAVYVNGRTVSASYFDVFEMRAALGRTFASDEDQPAKAHVVVLSHRLWASQFGSDPAVIGKPVRLDGKLSTVIGVMSAGAEIDQLDPDVWQPRDLGHEGGALTRDGHTTRGQHDLNRVVARLKPGVTLEQARIEMSAIGKRLADAYPASNTGWGVRVQPWPRPFGQDVERSLYLLLAAVGMVLLIACVNVASLTLARSTARAREVSIRAALGAGRGRLIRQVLTEHLMLAVGGGLCGLVVSYGVLAALTGAIPSTDISKVVPSDTTIVMDAWVLLFSLALTGFSGLACGVGPALGATRPALTDTINERGGTGGGGRARWRLRQTLVIAEVALAFVLLTTAGVLMQSFFTLQRRIGTGFDSTNVLTARVPIPPNRFKDFDALNAYFDRLTDRIQSLPGVRDVAFAEGLPTQGSPFGRSFQIADQPPTEQALRPSSGFKVVSPSYFRTLGLRIRKGRALEERDRAGAAYVVVVNETFAQMYFPGLNPLGQRILMQAKTSGVKDVAWEVVGVVADEGVSWNGTAEAFLYGAREQDPSDYLALVVRGALDPARLQDAIRKAVSAVDRDQALTDVESLDGLKTEFMASDRVRSLLLGAFAAVAITLAAIGLHGVLAYTVVQRTRELGIRAALGASPLSLVTLVARQGMEITGWGLALGLAGALVASRLITRLLFGIEPADPTMMAAVAGVLAVVALVACSLPARRATKVDPMVALRCE
jgi:putative ABC transport system permease protein